MDVKKSLPILPLRDIVVFPSMVIPLFVGRDKSITALNEVMKNDKKIVLVTQKNSEVDEPKNDDIFSYGCESNILQLLKLPDGTVKVLVEGNKRVKIIEKNKDRAELIANELNNTIVINGDGLDEDVLKEANIEEAETILSLTNDDEDNIMVSVLAEKNNPNKRTIALVNKQNYSLLQSSLKINDLVDPRLTTVSTILKHVHKGTIETVYTLLDGEYEFIEAEVLETSELISKSIKDSNLPKEIRIGAVVRGKDVVIPKSDFKFEKKDLVVFLTKREHLEKVESLFRISSLV